LDNALQGHGEGAKEEEKAVRDEHEPERSLDEERQRI
jgi:hypothetical protein